jgi:hypothetical protein
MVVSQFDKRWVGVDYRTERGSAGSWSQLKKNEWIRGNHNHPNLTVGIRRYRARFGKAPVSTSQIN